MPPGSVKRLAPPWVSGRSKTRPVWRSKSRPYHASQAASYGLVLLRRLHRVQALAGCRSTARPRGTLWIEPYRIDIMRALHAGRNGLTIPSDLHIILSRPAQLQVPKGREFKRMS